MKRNVIIIVLILMFTSFQVNAQCCLPKGEKAGVSNVNQQSSIKTTKFKITGITCAGCSNAIYNALKEVDGVINHTVEYPGDIAVIEYDNSKTNAEALIKVIEEKGFKAVVVKDKA